MSGGDQTLYVVAHPEYNSPDWQNTVTGLDHAIWLAERRSTGGHLIAVTPKDGSPVALYLDGKPIPLEGS